jgi:hypothetical protein
MARATVFCLACCRGAAAVALGVLAYFYYERRHEPVVKIDVPGFSGEIRKDNGGVDIEVGKDKP